jgi:Mg2+ and Co2+ transporter CorA
MKPTSLEHSQQDEHEERNERSGMSGQPTTNRAAQKGRAQLVESAGIDPDIDPDFVTGILSTGPFFWLDLAGVPVDRLLEFSAALGLSPDSEHHLVDQEQRSSFTETHDGIRWVAFGARDDKHLTQVRGVFTQSFLVTVHDEPCRGLAGARHRYERLLGSDQNDGPLVLFMVLDALASTFEAILARLDARLDELETAVIGGPPMSGYLQQVLEIRQLLTPIMRTLGPYRRDLVSILGDVDRLPGMQSGTQQYLDSHRNHVVALFDTANGCRDETRDAIQAFSSATSERQGEVINWLTIVAAVFLPLTFVTGYFGMNFSNITHLHGTVTFALLAVVLPTMLAVFTIVVLRFLIRRLGVRLIPSRLPRAIASSSITSSDDAIEAD